MAAPGVGMVPTLTFWERNVPFASMAAAKLAGAAVDARPDPTATKETIATLAFPSGEQLVGQPLIVRYMARAGTLQHTLYPTDALAATQVDQWIDYITSAVVSGSNLEPVLVALDAYLRFRTYMVGHAITLADVVLWGQLQGNPLWKKHKAGNKVVHLSRWFDHVTAVPGCSSAADELLAMDSKKLRAAAAPTIAVSGNGDKQANAEAGGSFDIQLPGAEEGKVVTRFPPEPSGYLHIGHAKAALLNQYFADMYKGKLIVRFDDTNPSKEKEEFVENILKDIKDLGLRYERLTYTSDYFPQMVELGEKMIRAGNMYADDTPVDQMRDERMKHIESKRRNRTVEENLHAWEEMKKGSEEGLTTCMRFKLDMTSANGTMRDPVAYRCNLTPHGRTGTKYKMYPTYDCACPFVDSLEGVTHALRTSEYRDREEQYYWVLKTMQKLWPGLPNVHIWDYSRLNFVNTLLSKRKLQWFVDEGRVEGWFDPRMPTVQGILRRGLRIEALREFILMQGASRNVTFQEWDKIWSINKRMIDPVCPRHTAIEMKGYVSVTMTNGPEAPEYLTVPRHKKYAPAGMKTQLRTSNIWLEQVDAKELSEGEEVTLMDWGNAFVRTIIKDANSGAPRSIAMELNHGGDPKKTKWKLTWLAQSDEVVPLNLVDFDYLINKKKVDEDEDFKELLTPVTKFEVAAFGDSNMRTLQKGDIIQLERKGYYIVDVPLVKAGQSIVLFSIPDGRAKSQALKPQ